MELKIYLTITSILQTKKKVEFLGMALNAGSTGIDILLFVGFTNTSINGLDVEDTVNLVESKLLQPKLTALMLWRHYLK